MLMNRWASDETVKSIGLNGSRNGAKTRQESEANLNVVRAMGKARMAWLEIRPSAGDAVSRF